MNKTTKVVGGPRAPHVVRASHIPSFILLPAVHLEYSISISDIADMLGCEVMVLNVLFQTFKVMLGCEVVVVTSSISDISR